MFVGFNQIFGAKRQPVSPIKMWRKLQGAWMHHVFYPCLRLYFHVVSFRNYADELNRRAKVETEIGMILAGKAPMPDKEQLRKWVLLLGVPTYYKNRGT